MEHTDKKQKENSVQFSDKKLEYIIANDLVEIEWELYYELKSSDQSVDVKTLYISIDDIVLAPKMSLFIETLNIDDKSILSSVIYTDKLIITFNSEEYSYELLLPDDSIVLNSYHSGTVMLQDKSRVTIKDNDTSVPDLDLVNIYEVKLDEKITIESLDRTFSKIYVPSEDLVIGFKVENIKINPLYLFSVDFNRDFNKPVLVSFFISEKEAISKEDSKLLNKLYFLRIFNTSVLFTLYGITFVVLLINTFITNDYFSFPWFAFIVAVIIHFIAINALDEKVREINSLVIVKKDDLLEGIKSSNIFGTIVSAIFVLFALFIFSRHYAYETDYVYDTVNQQYLESNSFNVSSDHIFDTKYITERYIPVEHNYVIDALYQVEGDSLLSFSNKYVDLEVNIDFKKCSCLIGNELSKYLKRIEEKIQAKISNGVYGNIANMDNYDYRKFLIDLEKDVVDTLFLGINVENVKVEDIINKIEIKVRYAKLKNID